MDPNQPFEHGKNFEPSDTLGNLRLGRFEAHYEELFADAIEDGVITAEERASLDRAASSLGLDRDRIARLEGALQAAYAARRGARVFEEGLPAAASLSPLAPSADLGTQALHQRIRFLEARVAELEHALEEAQNNAGLDVDLSGFSAAESADDDDPTELHRRLKLDPRDPQLLHALVRSHLRADAPHHAANVAVVLAYLNQANDDEKRLVREHRAPGLPQAAAALGADGWRRLLLHPEQEVLTGDVFATVASAVLLGRVSALRRANLIEKLDPESKQDPAVSTVAAIRCFGWAASLLGLSAPPLYVAPERPIALEMVPGIPPSTRLGQKALSGRKPEELAFLAGRHLTYYRAEHFLALLLPSLPDLEDVFLAALVIGNPGLPLRDDVKRRVEPIAAAIEPILEATLIDRLRGHFLRFVEEGGRTNLARWVGSVDRTASRAGFLLSGDLGAVERMLTLEGASDAEARIDDVLLFATSDRYAKLRAQMGLDGPTAQI